MEQFTGYQHLKIAVANKMGLDKESFKARIKWTEDNHEQLEQLMPMADEPLLYRKAVYALRSAEAKQPTGFIMDMDATASGLQIMAALSGCPTTASNVNLLNTGKREDIYAKVASIMSAEVGHEVTRATCKKPVNTIAGAA